MRKVAQNHRRSPNIGLRLVKCAKAIHGCRVTHAEKVRDVFSNDDIAVEIFSRLPIESIIELKCVCRRWSQILSHPFFRSAHFQKSPRTLSGLLRQGTLFCNYTCFKFFDTKEINYISFGRDGKITVTANFLNFLPENVVIIASCNGILLCRSFFEPYRHDHCCLKSKVIFDVAKEVVLYVCNPFTREFTTVKPEGKYNNGCCYGFVCDSSGVVNFEVIMVQCPLKRGKEPYLFAIYSSKTGTWRLSKEVCYFAEKLFLHQNWYVDGVFYWLGSDHNVLAFNLKEDSCQVIRLPGVALRGCDERGTCLGVSEGKLHYICFSLAELRVWSLEYDKVKPKWSVKHSRPRIELDDYIINLNHPSDYEIYFCRQYVPVGIDGDILFMRERCVKMIAYNIKTGKIDKDICSVDQLDGFLSCTPLMIPYYRSILQVPSEKAKETVC